MMMEIQPELLEQYEYLVELRDSGVTNMWGASVYLEDEFAINLPEAKDILVGWIKSFDLPEDEQPKDGR
jgi:hypothetical protein